MVCLIYLQCNLGPHGICIIQSSNGKTVKTKTFGFQLVLKIWSRIFIHLLVTGREKDLFHPHNQVCQQRKLTLSSDCSCLALTMDHMCESKAVSNDTATDLGGLVCDLDKHFPQWREICPLTILLQGLFSFP